MFVCVCVCVCVCVYVCVTMGVQICAHTWVYDTTLYIIAVYSVLVISLVLNYGV